MSEQGSAPAVPSLQMLIAAYRAGEAGEVERLARVRLSAGADDDDSLILLGLALQMQARPAEAVEHYAVLSRRKPGEAAHWSNLGNALREAGRGEEATGAFLQGLMLAPKDATLHYNLGLLSLDQADYAQAREHLLAAHAAEPAAVDVALYAARACYECGDQSEVERLLAACGDESPADPELRLELGWLLAQTGHSERAERLLAECERDLAEPMRARAQRILLLERVNRLDEAHALAQSLPAAASLDQAQRSLVLNVHATLARRAGDLAQARVHFEQMLAGPQSATERGNLYFGLAQVLDKLDQRDAAMQALEQAHHHQQALAAALVPELAAPEREPLTSALDRVSAADYAAWPQLDAPDRAHSPIFVVGFPRSGTTLLEQMLDAHPGLRSMDERAFIQDAADRIEEAGLVYPDDLGRLDQAACDQLRRLYWESVWRVAPMLPGQQRLVDKNPLNLLRLPMIRRLFPNAPIVLALRHPCDVLLSCYMQSFRSPAFALLCSSLPRLARGYANAMRFWLHHAQALRIEALELRYEDLVEHFAPSVERLAAYLQLDDAAPLFHFAEHARGKGYISTPSYSQVIEGINRKGLDRWRRYENHFAPLLPMLEPFLERFGYASR